MTHKDVWKVLFKGAEVPPPLTEDRGLSAKHHANPVSFYISQDIYSPQFNHVRDLSLHAKQDWVETAEQIDCPAPLLEDPTDALLTEMLTPAPYEVPVKKTKKKATRTRKGLWRKVVSDSSSDDSNAHSSHEDEEEEEESSPPSRGRQEKEGRPIRGGRRVQEGKDPCSGLFHDGRRQRRRVATQGQAPGEVVSIQTP